MMKTLNGKQALISGASFAGLSMAYWLNRMGCRVTIVELASGLREGGTPVNIKGETVAIVKRMGIFQDIESQRLSLESWEFKNAEGHTEGSMQLLKEGEALPEDDFEIERNALLSLLHSLVKSDVQIIFNESIAAISQTEDAVHVTFRSGLQKSYDFLFGCDGIHSNVRKLCFGREADYVHFLEQYFSITTVNKLLIKEKTAQMFNVPGKAVMLNAYNGKTDIILAFVSEQEIPYDYRDEAQQRALITDKFMGEGWRTAELLAEVQNSKTFYFDKLCQIRMPSWTQGRAALVGDAGYCASPAAGMGGSLAIIGAAALADALEKFQGNHEKAFQEYNAAFRPFIEEIQAEAVRTGLESLVPRTEEAIRKRNALTTGF